MDGLVCPNCKEQAFSAYQKFFVDSSAARAGKCQQCSFVLITSRKYGLIPVSAGLLTLIPSIFLNLHSTIINLLPIAGFIIWPLLQIYWLPLVIKEEVSYF